MKVFTNKTHGPRHSATRIKSGTINTWSPLVKLFTIEDLWSPLAMRIKFDDYRMPINSAFCIFCTLGSYQCGGQLPQNGWNRPNNTISTWER